MPLSASRLTTVLELLSQRRRRVARFDNTVWQSIDLTRQSLPFLSVFDISPRVGIGVHNLQGDTASVDLFCDFIVRHCEHLNNAVLQFYAREAATPVGRAEDFDLDVLFGWRDGEFVCGFSLGGKSPGHDDVVYRYKLFSRILVTMGVSQYVAAQLDRGRLFLKEGEKSPLTVLNTNACTDGSNPRAFNLRGFADLNAARTCVERLQGTILKAIDEVGFYARIPTDRYDEIRLELSQIASVWTCELYGTLSSSAVESIRTFNLPSMAIRGIPLFEWREKRDEVFYQGDVVGLGDKVVLEITSNCESMDHLLKRLRESTDLEFSPVSDDDRGVE